MKEIISIIYKEYIEIVSDNSYFLKMLFRLLLMIVSFSFIAKNITITFILCMDTYYSFNKYNYGIYF